GMYLADFSETVRIPHPQEMSDCIRVFPIRVALDRSAIPVNRHWPAFEVLTRQGFFSPSSASTKTPISASQNSSLNFFFRTAAFCFQSLASATLLNAFAR